MRHKAQTPGYGFCRTGLSPRRTGDDMRLKKTVKIFIGVFVAAILIGIVIIFMLSQRIVMNPPGTVGNTAGNLNNNGYFCEYDGTVYFYNSYRGGGLFAMNPDESDMRRLNTLNVRNILAGGKYLYFYQYGFASSSDFGDSLSMHTMVRSNLDGSNNTALTTDVVVTGQLVDNYLYLLTSGKSGPSFYKTKIDNSDKVKLADYVINPACAQNGIIYYNGTQGDHFLYALDTSRDAPREIWRGNLWNPVLEGDYVYYMDVANNYRLCRYSMSEGVIEVLTDDRVDCFNVGSGYIYYQKNDLEAPQLKCMHSDGSNVTVVAEGNYTSINMTSQYVYFQAFGDEFTMYHSRLGTGSYETFLAAESAAGE